MIRLFVSDMDGTLLNHDFAINKENIEAIHQLEAAGISFVVATGRIYMDAYKICQSHGLFPYIISSNGACIFAPNGMQIYGREIGSIELIDVIHYLEREKICYGIGTNTTYEIKPYWEAYIDREIERLENQGMFIPKDRVQFAKNEMLSQNGMKVLDEFPLDQPCYSISVMTYDHEAVEQLQTFLKSYGNLTCMIAGPHNIEIMNAAGDKGNTLVRLCQLLKVDMKDTAAIGDSLNDIHMIEAAGLGIAMGNARDEIKEVSDHITLDCLENGVAHAIYKILE